MRKYSPVIGLLAVITAMVIFQIGTLNADASSATTSSQSNQINRSATVGGPLMVPMDARLAKDAGGDKDADHDKKVGESEKKEDKPDLRTVDWYKTASAKEDDGNDEADEEGEGEDDEGGFDRLWDVVLNG
jgi:hypothetical protein